jgi:hypothetical protein
VGTNISEELSTHILKVEVILLLNTKPLGTSETLVSTYEISWSYCRKKTVRKHRNINVRFEVILAMAVKSTTLWDAATCSRWFLSRGLFYPEDAVDMFLRNVGSHKIYTAQNPRKRHSSFFRQGYI